MHCAIFFAQQQSVELPWQVGLAIATKYALSRRQFGDDKPGQPETPIMDYLCELASAQPSLLMFNLA